MVKLHKKSRSRIASLKTLPHTSRRRAFTIIELMVVVVILGVLAALALPALTGYVRQSKTGEATTNLSNLFKAAVSFYDIERAAQGVQGATSHHCVVEPAPMTPSVPAGVKKSFTASAGFTALGFSVADYVYYGYSIESIAAPGATLCDVAAGRQDVYTFAAHGDLDSDSTLSTFELAVGTDDNGTLFHGRGYYIVKPIE